MDKSAKSDVRFLPIIERRYVLTLSRALFDPLGRGACDREPEDVLVKFDSMHNDGQLRIMSHSPSSVAKLHWLATKEAGRALRVYEARLRRFGSLRSQRLRGFVLAPPLGARFKSVAGHFRVPGQAGGPPMILRSYSGCKRLSFNRQILRQSTDLPNERCTSCLFRSIERVQETPFCRSQNVVHPLVKSRCGCGCNVLVDYVDSGRNLEACN